MSLEELEEPFDFDDDEAESLSDLSDYFEQDAHLIDSEVNGLNELTLDEIPYVRDVKFINTATSSRPKTHMTAAAIGRVHVLATEHVGEHDKLRKHYKKLDDKKKTFDDANAPNRRKRGEKPNREPNNGGLVVAPVGKLFDPETGGILEVLPEKKKKADRGSKRRERSSKPDSTTRKSSAFNRSSGHADDVLLHHNSRRAKPPQQVIGDDVSFLHSQEPVGDRIEAGYSVDARAGASVFSAAIRSALLPTATRGRRAEPALTPALHGGALENEGLEHQGRIAATYQPTTSNYSHKSQDRHLPVNQEQYSRVGEDNYHRSDQDRRPYTNQEYYPPSSQERYHHHDSQEYYPPANQERYPRASQERHPAASQERHHRASQEYYPPEYYAHVSQERYPPTNRDRYPSTGQEYYISANQERYHRVNQEFYPEQRYNPPGERTIHTRIAGSEPSVRQVPTSSLNPSAKEYVDLQRNHSPRIDLKQGIDSSVQDSPVRSQSSSTAQIPNASLRASAPSFVPGNWSQP